MSSLADIFVSLGSLAGIFVSLGSLVSQGSLVGIFVSLSSMAGAWFSKPRASTINDARVRTYVRTACRNAI